MACFLECASLNGEDGKSCSIKEVPDGIEVTCPGSEPVTIKNGAAGSNCIIDSDKDGKVVLKCGEGENAVTTTLYKAMCDVTPYDPAEKFCHDLRLYDKCGSPKVAYNIDKQFCAKFEYKTEQLYRYVTIAPKGKKYSKTWMAENLNYESAAGSYCYGDSAANCAKYGRLYTWAAAVNKSESECGYGHECNLGTGFVRGVCPEGWHLPSLDEWKALIAAVDTTISAYSTSNVAGTSLKSTSGWNDYHNNTGNGKDAYTFSALPAGLRAGSGVYANKGFRTCFWSSSTKNEHSAYHMDLDVKNEYYDDGIALLGYLSKDNGFSIRCVKD